VAPFPVVFAILTMDENGRIPPTARLGALPLPWWFAEPATRPKPDLKLYVKGAGDRHAVDPSDVQQGQLPDCFLMAGLSAVVMRHPDPDAFMRKVITDHGDGTYTVTFLDRDEPTGRRSVRVNTDFHQSPDPGYPGHAHSGKGSGEENERWAAIVERGYIKAYGHAGTIKEGGSPGTVMERLTGLPGTAFTVAPSALDHPDVAAANARAGYAAPKLTLDTLAGLHRSGHAITFGTFDKATASTNPAYFQPGGLPNNQAYPYAQALRGDHAYVVTNVDVTHKTVTVHNPWDQKEDIVIPYDDLQKVFLTAHANPVK
jgi:hypothetical protein